MSNKRNSNGGTFVINESVGVHEINYYMYINTQ